MEEDKRERSQLIKSFFLSETKLCFSGTGRNIIYFSQEYLERKNKAIFFFF